MTAKVNDSVHCLSQHVHMASSLSAFRPVHLFAARVLQVVAALADAPHDVGQLACGLLASAPPWCPAASRGDVQATDTDVEGGTLGHALHGWPVNAVLRALAEQQAGKLQQAGALNGGDRPAFDPDKVR